jgi:subtilisin-like proprotein convertase family protein
MAVAALTAPIWAQRTDQRFGPVSQDQYPNFDVRWKDGAAGVAYMDRYGTPPASPGIANMAGARAAGLARLQADLKTVDVVDSPELGTPEVVSVKPESGFLTGPTADRVGAMRAFLSAYSDVYGLSQEQAAGLELVADYANPAGNMAWVELEQRLNGLPVFRGLIRGGFTEAGELARTTGQLAPGLDAKSLPVSPTLTAAQAVSAAAANVGWIAEAGTLVQTAAVGGRVTFARGPFADESKAWLLYFPVAPGVARLAWATEIWGDPDAFMILLDAEDGTVLFRKNLTSYQTQSATYVVYNDDSPAPLSPTTALPGTGAQAPFISRTSVTLIGNEAPNTFNNLGWMTDNTTFTDGNNVEAGLDRDGINGVDAPVNGVSRAFNFVYNPATDEALTLGYQQGEVTDTFYMTNWYHDRLYLLGFTEAARNFQNDNFGRGGVASDRISAEAQDSSGTNNANFSTPSDGGRGRMQMYLFTGPTPDRTSGLDHDVLLHELTHGTSNRLHSNASGLTTTMSRGMGEGWSDFFPRALLASASEGSNGIYTTGGWVTYLLTATYTDNYYYGIRRFPYAAKSNVGGNGKPHNPLTFADIDPAQINTTDGAYPRSPISGSTAFQVHNIGEVWASALNEVRERFITRLGFAVGNQRTLQFVTDGMKLDPVNPTLLQGRDSIIAAANAGGGTAADIADIRTGFAVRGMGFSAQVVNAATGTVVEAFDVSGSTLSLSDVSVAEGNSGTTNATFTVSLSPASSGTVTVDYATANGTATATAGGTTTAANSASISIPSSGVGTPYPSNITVPAGIGNLTKVTATLVGFSHTFPSDVDVLLVGPGGQTVILMSDTGSGTDAVNVNFVFDDTGPALGTGTLVSGTYQPTNYGAGDAWPSPAPAAPYGTVLSVFNGLDPAGVWKLFVVDDLGGDSGSFAGGWSLTFTAPAQSTGDFTAVSGTLTFSAGQTSKPVTVTVNGDTTPEAHETFFLNLSNASLATIDDSQGLGTILNDDTLIFTDPTLAAGVTPIKVVHIMELRTRINAVRAAKGLGAYSFTDSSLTAGTTLVKAVHILELRTALAAAYVAAGMTPPTYAAPVPAAGVVVTATAISELRAAVIAIE